MCKDSISHPPQTINRIRPIFVFPIDETESLVDRLNLVRTALKACPTEKGVTKLIIGPENYLCEYTRLPPPENRPKRVIFDKVVNAGQAHQLLRDLLRLSREFPGVILAPGSFYVSEPILPYLRLQGVGPKLKINEGEFPFKEASRDQEDKHQIARHFSPVLYNGTIVSLPPKGAEFTQISETYSELGWFGEDGLGDNKYIFWGGHDTPEEAIFNTHPIQRRNRVFFIQGRKIGLTVCVDLENRSSSLPDELCDPEKLDLYLIQSAGKNVEILEDQFPTSFIKDQGAIIYCNHVGKNTFNKDTSSAPYAMASLEGKQIVYQSTKGRFNQKGRYFIGHTMKLPPIYGAF